MALGAYEKTPYEGKWPSTIIESFVVYEIIEYAVYPNGEGGALKALGQKCFAGSSLWHGATGY